MNTWIKSPHKSKKGATIQKLQKKCFVQGIGKLVLLRSRGSGPTEEICRICQGAPHQRQKNILQKENKQRRRNATDLIAPWALSGVEQIKLPAAKFSTWPWRVELLQRRCQRFSVGVMRSRVPKGSDSDAQMIERGLKEIPKTTTCL